MTSDPKSDPQLQRRSGCAKTCPLAEGQYSRDDLPYFSQAPQEYSARSRRERRQSRQLFSAACGESDTISHAQMPHRHHSTIESSPDPVESLLLPILLSAQAIEPRTLKLRCMAMERPTTHEVAVPTSHRTRTGI